MSKTTTTQAGERTHHYITRAKGGTDERKVKAETVEIPDLWYHDGGDGKVHECWHLAHDLKRELLDVFAQRDALLAACRLALPYVRQVRANSNGIEHISAASDVCNINTAIAQAEGRAK